MLGKIVRKSISVVLTLALLIQIVPSGMVYAVQMESVPRTSIETEIGDEIGQVGDADTDHLEISIDKAENLESSDIRIVGEETSLRTETEKHYRLEDGSYIAVSYGVPVHYQDNTGRWQEIDTSLQLRKDVQGQNVLQSKNELTEVYFSEKLEDGKILTSSVEDTSVSLYLLDTTRSYQKIEDDPATVTAYKRESFADRIASYNREAKAVILEHDTKVDLQPETDAEPIWGEVEALLKKLENTIQYEDVFPGVDLHYTVFGNSIKEEIVINEPQSTYQYDFRLELDGLVAKLNMNGSVSLLNQDAEQLYFIPAPFMFDSNGVQSDAVQYTLTQDGEHTKLTVTADMEWINAAERVFPITIDPTIIVQTPNGSENLEDEMNMYATYVIEGLPNKTQGNYQSVYMGYTSAMTQGSIEKNRVAYFHFNNIPDIPQGSIVTDVNLNLYMCRYSHVGCSEMTAGIYEVTDTLPSNKSDYYDWLYDMNWSNKADYDIDNVIDYTVLKSSQNQAYYSWDITELGKKWYNEEGYDNRTIALDYLSNSGNFSNSHCAGAAFQAYGVSTSPVLFVHYRSNLGIEPYYTYRTLNVGNAGVAYIGDESGQLKVITPLVSYASIVNPVSVNLTYNSDYFTKTSSTSYQPPSKLGLDMTLGHGWTLDIIQKMEDVTISGFEYKKYTDGDGTIHYFRKKDDGLFYDEDGLGLKVEKKGTGNYTMTDDHGNSWMFTNSFLTKITNADGNQVLVNYENNRLKNVKQKNNNGNIVTFATFTYSETGNTLSSITDAVGNVYSLGFSSSTGNLTVIRKNGEVYVRYLYFGHRIRRLVDEKNGNYAITFTYADGKIASYNEIIGSADTGTTGAQVSVAYPNYSKTIYRDYGTDRVANTEDDILTHYAFDYTGRTINAYCTDNENNILGASNATYSQNTGTDKKNNRTTNSGSIGKAAQQLLHNTSCEFENSYAWYSTNAVISTEKARTGTKALKATLGSTWSGAYRVTTPLTTGKVYTFSAYVNTSSAESFTGNGVYLRVNDESTGSVWNSGGLTYQTSESIEGGWVRLHVTFEAESNSQYVVYLRCDGGSGFVYADDFQVEKGDSFSEYNMVHNGSLETNTLRWTLKSQAVKDTTTGVGGSSDSIKITGVPGNNTESKAYQDIPLNLPATETFVLSGWIKANAVPDNLQTAASAEEDTVKQCGLRMELYYTDGTKNVFYAPFNPDLSDWQFVSQTIVPKSPSKQLNYARIICTYEGNANAAYFDNISLVREAAQTYAYDDDGNLKSVKSPGLTADVNTYDEGNLIKSVTAGFGTYDYVYDETFTHRMTDIKAHYLTQSMTYDNVGNVTETVLEKAEDASTYPKLKSSATYSGSGNLMKSVTDVNGIRTKMEYGSGNNYVMLGIPNYVEDAAGTKQYQTIDADGRTLSAYIDNTVRLNYTYANGNLTKVTRSDLANSKTMDYNFTFDTWGNMTSAKVGNNLLASYEYSSGNGLLTKMTYGNGNTIQYVYDILDRETERSFDNGAKVAYTYGGDGLLNYVTETHGNNKRTNYFYYDALDRLISSRTVENGETVLQTGAEYNAKDQLTAQNWLLQTDGGTKNYRETYIYNGYDGKLRKITDQSGRALELNYDPLRRLQYAENSVYKKEYVYRNISDTQTTNQISTLKYMNLPVELTYSYTYDALGNIKTISDPLDGAKSYTYDAQGQMLTEKIGSNTYTYTYDNVGNILTANTSTGSHTYRYENTGWRDQLTHYDNEPLAYDAIGNPTRYYNGTCWTMTWQNGRQLATASDGTTNVSYAYDYTSGMRTKKTVGSTETRYYYAGDKLMRMETGNNVLDFFYDQNGQPYAVNYNGTMCYYVLNLQGDVVRIVSSVGTSYGIYQYDAWGNILYSTNSSLVNLNPLRYRGYVYDTETGFYYLQSRYYDPKIGRYINADDVAQLGVNGDFVSYNLFVYCGNNPVIRKDTGGYAWETVFDIISLGTSIIEVSCNPADVGAWIGLVGDIIDVAVPFVAGVGETVRVINAGRKIADAADDINDARRVASKIHGNSLSSNKINYGYQLIDKNNNVVKYGESKNPLTRYSKKFLTDNELRVQIKVAGTKRGVHEWQHYMIENYTLISGSRPDLNHSFW